MEPQDQSRRTAFAAVGALAGASILGLANGSAAEPGKGKGPGQEKDTPAVEDLMREHGVLRRALLVYQEVAPRIRAAPDRFDAKALWRTARLFRDFGEDYHEQKLEEAHIFPVVRKAGGPAAAYPDVLTAQHDRGREVTEFILAVTKGGSIGAANAEPLAIALERFVLMYENHAAREDTIVFPAWKLALSQRQIDALGDQFEDIERKQFGKDGYEDAVKQIAQIEAALGLADIDQFTAPPPPRA
ncbi:MAG TPA: hemerythrin domain-containing protein [Caulobacteraceae bacterium]|jgi:hemerythrin-like domain-containing protein